MSVIVGPWTAQDATPAELARAQAVAALLPPDMVARDAPGTISLWFHKRPRGVQSWAWGYTPSGRSMWVNPRKVARSGTLDGQQRYVLAHEYAHAWMRRHGRRLTESLRALVVGQVGNYQGPDSTNRASEALADAFARSLGLTDGPRLSYYQASIPSPSWGAMIEILSGKGPARPPRATHTFLRSGLAALRESPLVSAPVVAWAASGSLIRAVAGRSGGRYYVRAAGHGYRSRLWLEVVALDGVLLPAPLWAAELLWAPLPAMPRPALPSSPA